MPQHHQHSLIHVLLLWITILSIVQVVFIVFFFTDVLSQNSSAVASGRKMPIQANSTTLPPSDRGHLLGKGKMLNFKVGGVEKNIKWIAKNPDPVLIAEEEGGTVLRIKKDGYFFVNLQVTLDSCNANRGSQQSVRLMIKDKVALNGWINTNTCSTGFLGKVEELPARATLRVSANLTHETIKKAESYLDIIYINRPLM